MPDTPARPTPPSPRSSTPATAIDNDRNRNSITPPGLSRIAAGDRRARVAARSVGLTLAIAAVFALGPWRDSSHVETLSSAHAAQEAFSYPRPAAETSSPAFERVAPSFDPLGPAFVANRGQVDARVRYVLRSDRGSLFFLDDRVVEVYRSVTNRPPQVQQWRFAAAEAGRWVASDVLPGEIHYLLGADPAAWATGLKRFSTLRFIREDGSQGLVFALSGGELSLVDQSAGARSSDLPTRAWLDARGRPMASPLHGSLLDTVSPASTRSAGVRLPLGPSRVDEVLQADPALVYSTYLGGGNNEPARALAVDAEGFAYVAGATTSDDFPVLDPQQGSAGNSGRLQDAFVAKLNPAGDALVYATYFGGARQDEALGLAVDAVGRVHITGYTTSPDFPMEIPIQNRVNLADGIFSGDAFATRFSPEGDKLEFSTPLGGTARDIGKAIAVDDEGFVYVTGWTGSNFPGVNALYPFNRGVTDAFVVKMTPAGDDVVYSTHLGGSVMDRARDIAVDGEGRAYIVGTTESVNFRVSEPLQRANAGAQDAFVARFAADGQTVEYATYLGGRGSDHGLGIAVSETGEATVVGWTDSVNFKRIDAIQNQRSGPNDLFVSRISADGRALVYSSYYGGSADEAVCAQEDQPRVSATATPNPRTPTLPEGSKFPDGPVADIAVDDMGRAYIVACSSSRALPGDAPRAPIQSSGKGRFTSLLSVLSPDGQSLEFSTFLGGQGIEVPRGIAVDLEGSIYVAGQTTSTDYPTAPGTPIQAGRRGTDDAFVTKIGEAVEPPPTQVPPPTETPESTPTSLASDTPTATETPEPTDVPATDTPAPPTATEGPEGGVIYLPVVCSGCD